MGSGPVAAMVWEGRDVVKTGRVILGATNPLASAPGTIRGDFAIDVGRNVCHGSDSVESAKKEIALWFKPEEVQSWTQAQVRVPTYSAANKLANNSSALLDLREISSWHPQHDYDEFP